MSTTNDNPSNTNTGVGPAVYYGSIAVALALIIAITVGSRLIYKRRQRIYEQTRDREERLALERRGEAAGLPTYYESRITNIGLPLYTMTYEAPATVAPTLPLYPPSSGPGGVNQLPAPSPTQENHFHFHFPSLPAALHLRPRRQDDPQPLLATHTYPPNSSTEPPKYEHSYLDTSPDETAYHHQEANDEAVREAEYHEPFIHPEELRRTRREQGRSEDEVEEIGGPGQAVEQEVVASQVPLPKEEEESSSVPATQSQPPPPVELPKSLSNHSPV